MGGGVDGMSPLARMKVSQNSFNLIERYEIDICLYHK